MSQPTCRPSQSFRHRLCATVAIGFWVAGFALCGAGQTRAAVPTFDATDLRQPTYLAGTWLVPDARDAGDNPAYARADFDDSHWKPFKPFSDSLHDLYPNTVPDVVWYRLHLRVSPNQTGLALQDYFISAASELYSDGVELIQVGQVAPFRPNEYTARLIASIPADQIATGSVVLALRVHITKREWTNAFPGYYPTNLTLGQRGALEEHRWLQVIGGHVLEWLSALVSAGLSLGALLLYTAQRRQREYLWLCLLGLAQIWSTPLDLYSLFHTYPSTWQWSNALPGLAIPFLLVQMYFAFVQRRVGWRFQVYLTVAGLMLVYASFHDMGASEHLLWRVPFLLLEMAILPGVIFAHWRRGNPEAGILLVPLFITAICLILLEGSFLVAQIPAYSKTVFNGFYRATEHIDFGPFQIPMLVVAHILSSLSLALILLLRSNRMSRQQALLEGEVAAAREVQQVILPEQIESIPGFTIESVYEPAQQVGGDFFQVLPTGDGGLLLVLGDVAGKGLPAAMLVSVLVGAIRTVADYTTAPDEILASLNERLMGRANGGFSTALAAHIAASGSVTIANAGHLSPYMDGRELAIPGALPLGILSCTRYETTTFRLPSGSRLTFYSDGVIEAQNEAGELFGFERGQEFSTQPAVAIVNAAKGFGQSDDITVVAITRDAAVAAAA